MRDELAVRRMVRRFDADYLRFERAVVFVEVSEEVELRLRWPDEKDVAVTLEGARDLAKVPMLVVGVIPDAQVDLIGVTMDVASGRIDERRLDLLGLDLEDPCLFLVDPYDCVFHDEVSKMKGV